MPTYWQKTAWWPGDLDPVSGLPLPGALPRGIYCEDDAAWDALLKGASETGKSVGADWGAAGLARLGGSIGGMRGYVATPAQAEVLRAMPARSPTEALAEDRAAFEASLAEVNRLMGQLVAPKPAPRPAPPATRHPFSGANRKAKRAAAARARRKA